MTNSEVKFSVSSCVGNRHPLQAHLVLEDL